MAPDNPRSIEHVVVAVPARNEAATIAQCLDSVVASATHLAGVSKDRSVPTITVVVACDSCTDETASLVGNHQPLLPPGTRQRIEIRSVIGVWSCAGGARGAAVRHGLALYAGEATTDPGTVASPDGVCSPDSLYSTVWLATTDADSSVPEDWLRRHLHYAADGFDAVAGIVELIEPDVQAAGAFQRIYSLAPEREHIHVHGANIGVRASAYLAAGGFPPVPVSEDHALWNRLRRDGRRCVSPLDVVVRTSARRIGRAPGGFADTLAAAIRAEGLAG